ncbi:MAG TPA: MFS transporter [Actinoplanes sp.]
MSDTRAVVAFDYRRVVVAGSIGTAIEVYDTFVYGYFATVLARLFFPTWDPTAALLATFAIFAVGFFVRPIGAIIFGHVGDRIGRRTALAFSLLLMTLATVAFGLLPTYASVGLLAPVLLLLCRLLQGLSASAEAPGAILLILEHAPRHRRGRAVSINNAAANLGSAAAAAVGLTLAKTLSAPDLATWGWRVAFLLAAPIGLVGLYIRTRLLDPPVFLALGEAARQGRAPLLRALSTAKRPMFVFMAWMAVSALAGYMVVSYLPSYLVRVVGLSQAEAFEASLFALLVQGAAALVGGYLADRYPLRNVAIGAIAGLAVVAVPGLLIINAFGTMGAAVLGLTLWALFVGSTYSVGTILSLTLFPVAIRFTATAVALNLGFTLFGGTAPYVSTWLVASTGSPIAPGVYLCVVAVVGLVVAVIGLPRADTALTGQGLAFGDAASMGAPDGAGPRRDE